MGTVDQFLAFRRAETDRLPQEIAAHPQQAPGHDVVERRHPPEQRDILEGAGNTLRRGLVGPHLPADLALPGNRARLRMVEAIYNVQHRSLAGALRPADREDLATPNLDADRVERRDPAKGEADPLGCQDRLAAPFLHTRHAPSALP